MAERVPWDIIRTAIRTNDNDTIKRLLRDRKFTPVQKITAVGELPESPIHMASRLGKAAILATLLGAVADPRIASGLLSLSGMTPLDLASMGANNIQRATPGMDYVGTIKTLLDAGVNPNPPLGAYSTALHIAVRNKDPDLCRGIITVLIVDGKADPDRLIKYKQTTPLIEAVKVRNICAIQTLLSLGARPEVSTDNGTTALHTLLDDWPWTSTTFDAVRVSGTMLTILHILLIYNAPVNRLNNKGWTPLHEFAFGFMGMVSIKDRLVMKDVLDMCMEFGARLDIPDQNDDTVIEEIERADKAFAARLRLRMKQVKPTLQRQTIDVLVGIPVGDWRVIRDTVPVVLRAEIDRLRLSVARYPGSAGPAMLYDLASA